VEVIWTDNALAALASIHDYVAEGSPSRAERLIEGIVRRSDQIAEFPESGRMVPGHGRWDLRELIEGRYRIIYIIGERRIDVLTVVHVRRELPWKRLADFR
jgi:toxin ParE1/3/4